MNRDFLAALRREARESPESRQGIVCGAPAGSNRVRFAWPDGAFYLFLAIDGVEDTWTLALRPFGEAGLGIAPGTAFGSGAELLTRICFARRAEDLSEAMHCLGAWLES